MKPQKKAVEMSPQELGRYIDQSVLKPEFTQAEVQKYMNRHGFNRHLRVI